MVGVTGTSIRSYWDRKGSGAEVSSAQDRMMSETFTNWLTRLQNLTHVGRTHTRAPAMFIIIMIRTELISWWGKERCHHPWSWQWAEIDRKEWRRVWRWSTGGGGFSTIAESLPLGPRTAGKGTAAAASRRLEPEKGLRLQCWSSAQSDRRLSGRFPGSHGPAGIPACPDLRTWEGYINAKTLFKSQVTEWTTRIINISG